RSDPPRPVEPPRPRTGRAGSAPRRIRPDGSQGFHRIQGGCGLARVSGGARCVAGDPPRPDRGLPRPRRQRTRRAAGRLLVAGLLRCLPRAANRAGALTPCRPRAWQARTSVEVRRFGLDVARQLRVHDLTLAVRIERHAAVLAELGFVELGPDADLSDTDLAQHLAN